MHYEAHAKLIFGVPLPPKHTVEFEALEEQSQRTPHLHFHGDETIKDTDVYLGYEVMSTSSCTLGMGFDNDGTMYHEGMGKILEELHWRPELVKMWKAWHDDYDHVYEHLDKDPLPKEMPEPRWYLLASYG